LHYEQKAYKRVFNPLSGHDNLVRATHSPKQYASITGLHDARIISFLFKMHYNYALYKSVLHIAHDAVDSQHSYMLLPGVLRSSNSQHARHLLSMRRVRVAFHNFLSGRGNTRAIFLSMRAASAHSVIFAQWFFNRYAQAMPCIRAHSIKRDVAYYITLLLQRSVHAHSRLAYTVLLKLHGLVGVIRSNGCLARTVVSEYLLQKFTHAFEYRLLTCRILLLAQRMRHMSITTMLQKKALTNLAAQIEHTLYECTKVPHLFIARYYYKAVPPLTSAKMLCEYVIMLLTNGYTIIEAFNKTYNWQSY
jgi:hypothetical protein